MKNKCFIEYRAPYADTDKMGVVYYANYLRYLERARTEYFESVGLSLKSLKEKGIQFVVRHVDIEYIQPAKYGDILIVETEIEKMEKARLILKNTILNKNTKKIISNCKTTLICINQSFKPVRIPQEIKNKIKLL